MDCFENWWCLVIFFRWERCNASPANGSSCEPDYNIQTREETGIHPCGNRPGIRELFYGLFMAEHAHHWCLVEHEGQAVAWFCSLFQHPLPFSRDKDAVAQLIRSCFSSFFGHPGTSPHLTSHRGVSGLLGDSKCLTSVLPFQLLLASFTSVLVIPSMTPTLSATQSLALWLNGHTILLLGATLAALLA